jgi:pimeloyl-ACP methyl ester carboxylesterase
MVTQSPAQESPCPAQESPCPAQESPCLAQESPSVMDVQAKVGGKLIKAERIGVYDAIKLNAIVNEELEQFLAGSPGSFEKFNGRFSRPKFNVWLYKLTFTSQVPELNNLAIESTGLVAIPETFVTELPLLSYQHGTVFEKNQVPTQPENSFETKLLLSQFASQGYVVIAADYIGLGDSDLPNSYFQRASTEQTCLDLYSATLEFLEKQAKLKVNAFFTFGWSQGGYNNMIFLRRLEDAEIPVNASATASAPVDLEFFILRGLSHPRPCDAVYTPAELGNMLFAFERYHNLPGLAREAIRPEYYQMAEDFYFFKLDLMEYLKKSTSSTRDFLNPEFARQLEVGQARITGLLEESKGYRWLSRTPLRAYTGGKDEAVPDYLARFGVDYQTLLGKNNGEAVSAGQDADHRETYVFAALDLKPWFDSFLK